DIVCGREFLMDVGEFNENRWFCYIAAFGLFTDVPYETPQEDKRALGRLAYLLNGVRTLADVKPIHAQISCEGQTVDAELIDGLVCSTTSVGGFKLGQGDLGIALDDGKSEVVLVKNIHNLADFGNVAAHLLRREFQNDAFIWHQTGAVRFSFDKEVAWTLDGEYGGTHKDVGIKIHRQKLRILIPNA
ncbi:MAG: diacylglycerol kinase family lipid kinase, partial [Oscillospiraceae bacterium]|nr:diacylglycerol kinase family lipid kinase [Oscillospiraceae bacterium]